MSINWPVGSQNGLNIWYKKLKSQLHCHYWSIMIIIIINQSQHQACKYCFSKGHLSDQVTTFCRTNQKSSGQYLQLVHVPWLLFSFNTMQIFSYKMIVLIIWSIGSLHPTAGWISSDIGYTVFQSDIFKYDICSYATYLLSTSRK